MSRKLVLHSAADRFGWFAFNRVPGRFPKLAFGLLGAAAMLSAVPAASQGWPSQHEGVMLQGFFWDSHSGANNSKWATLTSQADELSSYFNIIWVPNGAKAASSPSMGYDPVYWFSQYNTVWGTKTELQTMISTFRQKGTGIMADVVINHRSGKSNWTDFPKEMWDGEIFQLGPEHICRNDEVAYATGQATPTGNYDTGENFDGSRDLDHTNATVQWNCKRYTEFLLKELGFCGFRYDMVKGYAPKYTKMYNQYSNPTYSVGEYWDGSYDALKAWVDGTGKTSAAFDFAFKFNVNDAFHSNDLSKLVWKANGTTDQPCGLIHFGYPRYAVTFIDNHDTYREAGKFNGNILAANAFMLSCPGTPCVFLPHWQSYKAQLKPMIQARLDAGVHNESAVRVLKTGKSVYLAEITGKRGTMAVRIGSTSDVPSGYTSSDVRCSGTGYCIWVRTNGSGPVNPPSGEAFTVYYDNASTNWATPHIHYWGDSESSWPGVAMKRFDGSLWQYAVPAGTTGVLFNAGDGDATKTQDFVAQEGHVYTKGGSQGHIDNYVVTPVDPTLYPASVYVVGNLSTGSWTTATPQLADSGRDGLYTWNDVRLLDSGNGNGYFSFITAKGSDWNAVNGSDRYGSATKDEAITAGVPSGVTLFRKNENAASANSWKAAPGTYRMTLDLTKMKLTLSTATDVVDIENEPMEIRWFNLQGVEVREPRNGFFIEVRNGRSSKVFVP